LYTKIGIILLLALLTSGCLADALTQETYVDPDNENNTLILFVDGSYRWHQTNYDKSGEWYEEEEIIYLNIDSFFGDQKLIKKGSSVFWSNGAEWVKN